MVDNEMKQAALDYAVQGIAVHPLNGKRPILPNGVDGATTNAELISEWWTRNPKANIGARIPDGVAVIDIDVRNLQRGYPGPDGFPWLDTRTAITGRRDGGRHYWIQDAGPLPKWSGVDYLRGNRYVILPPSIHPETGWSYCWESLSDIAPMPDLLRDIWEANCDPEPEKPRVSLDVKRWNGRWNPQWLLDRMAATPSGRNHVLYDSAYAMCQDKVAGKCSKNELEDGLERLHAAVVSTGYPPRKADSTINSAIKAVFG